MNIRRARSLIRKAVAVAYPKDSAIIGRHINETSKLSMEELEELMRTDEGMQKIAGPLRDIEPEPVPAQSLSEFVEAKPGPMTDAEFARVLSGGTRKEWGPARRLAKELVARRRRK